MKYGNLTLGQIESIVNKLGGLNGVKDLLGDELIISRKPIPEKNVEFATIHMSDAKTNAVRVGVYAEQCYKYCEDEVVTALRGFIPSENIGPCDINLFIIGIEDMRLPANRPACFDEVRSGATAQGYFECCPEIAIHLVSNYKKTLLRAMEGEPVYFLSRPLYGARKRPVVLRATADMDSIFLSCTDGTHDKKKWDKHHKFVVAKRA